MELSHRFSVPTPVPETWDRFASAGAIADLAECFPGAQVTSAEGDSFEGTVKVKLGPIALVYAGSGTFVEKDEAARRLVVEAKGRDKRGNGTAGATATITMAEDPDRAGATAVEVRTELSVTGKPAQFGRGMIAEVSGKLLGQFADCLADTLGAASPEPAESAREPAAEPADEPADVDAASRTALAVDAPAGGTAPVERADPPDDPARREHSHNKSVVDTTDSLSGSRDTPPETPDLSRPVGSPRPTPVEAEPVDLLRLTGSTQSARRIATRGAATVVLAVAAWVVLRWLRRS